MDRPKRLFKYQPVSIYSLKNLKNNCIYFNDPYEFNDPYDSIHPIDLIDLNYEKLVNLIFGNQNGSIPKLFIKLEKDTITIHEFTQFVFFLSKDIPDLNLKLILKLNLNKEDFKKKLGERINNSDKEFINLKNYIKEELIKFLNREVRNTIEILKKEHINNMGVSCFSGIVNDILMWSYYTDGHKGFCLEYNTDYEPFSRIIKVDYDKSFPKIDLSKILNENDNQLRLAEVFFGTKFNKWKHEEEWRVIHEKNKIQYTLMPNALSAVYFGTKMDFTSLQIISLIVKGQNPNTKLYQMNEVSGEYKIKPEEINYTSFQEAKEIVLSQISEKLKEGIFDVNELQSEVNIPASKEQLATIIKAIIDDIKLKNN